MATSSPPPAAPWLPSADLKKTMFNHFYRWTPTCDAVPHHATASRAAWDGTYLTLQYNRLDPRASRIWACQRQLRRRTSQLKSITLQTTEPTPGSRPIVCPTSPSEWQICCRARPRTAAIAGTAGFRATFQELCILVSEKVLHCKSSRVVVVGDLCSPFSCSDCSRSELFPGRSAIFQCFTGQ